MDVDTHVWVKTKDAAIWAPGQVVEYQAAGGKVQVRRLDTDELVLRRYPGFAQELCLRNTSVDFSTMRSLTSLEHLHEAALLQALSARFDHDEIYTSIGDILVVLNPLKPLPQLYSQSQLDLYKHNMQLQTPSAKPHIFAISANAFAGLLQPERRNQSILVSGESGSGKTESTKFLMQFLTSVGRDYSRKKNGAVEIGRRILQTNPILESFGNAQTIRNDNSSRFGKFIKIQFGAQNEILGAQIVSYLLEKVRLLHQNPEEHNFHIFYQLLEGANTTLLQSLGLQKGANYALLNSYGPHFAQKTTAKYAQMFAETVRAFKDTGVSEQERMNIFQILAALLHLGNVEFQHEEAIVTANSELHLQICAKLLSVDVQQLENLLTSRAIKAGVEVMIIKLNPAQAKEICGSLAKSIYGRLFTWLVRRLSDEINFDEAFEDETLASIGILDIFGFESLNCNGFEQLCINYANERLQAQFNEFVFVREQQVYIAEGIEWRNIAFPSNAECLALFDDKSKGLFSLLDQECLMPKGSNPALSTKFYRYHGGNAVELGAKHVQSNLPLFMTSFSRYLQRSESQEEAQTRLNPFSASKMERVKNQFVVHHFAGRVCYNVEQFVEKNTDALPADVNTILSSSIENQVVRAIGAEENVDFEAQNAAGRRRYSTLRAPSVSSQFKSQLDRLLVQIGRTEAHYVRCLKPNESKKAGVLNRERMVEQMRSVGVLEAVRIARFGYSVRLAHSSFIDLFSGFKCLLNAQERVMKMNDYELAQALVTVLMDKMLLEGGQEKSLNGIIAVIDEKETESRRKDVQVGKTLVFCKTSTYNCFVRYRLELRNYCATVLQKHVRGYCCRKRFQEVRTFVVHVQAIVRGFLGRKRVDRLRLWRREKAATEIQACWKRFGERRKFAQMLQLKRKFTALLRIQAQIRRFLAQRTCEGLKREKREVKAAFLIQKQCKPWIKHNKQRTAKLQRFQLKMAFNKFQRACVASQSAEMETEPSPSEESASSQRKRVKSTFLPLTQSSSEQDDSSASDSKLEPPIRISTPMQRRPNRQRSRANSRRNRTGNSDRNSLLENEILRLQQMLVEQNGSVQRATRPPRSSPLELTHTPPRKRTGRRRYSVSGAFSDDEDGEMNDELSLLPRRTRSVLPGQEDNVSALSQKIEELDAKCKFLEQLVARKTYQDAYPYDRERLPSADNSLYGDAVSETGSDVDSIIFNIQNQMNVLRKSIAVKEQVVRKSFSSSTRPTRSSSIASWTSFAQEAPSLPSLPLSESQFSAGGDSSLGLPLTPTSSITSSFYQGPPRSAPAHFGGRGMPRIVKWARSTNCYECQDPFNLFVRRHHCRMCGNSFCHEHSSRRVSVFGIGFDEEPVRVCDNCFSEYYTATQEPLTPPYPQQYGGFNSAPTSSRLSGL